MSLKLLLTPICVATLTAAVQASDLAQPADRVLLTVSGEIAKTNIEQTAQFDRQMLQKLNWTEVVSYTSLTEGPQVFAGPTLSSLLDAVEAKGAKLRATAIDDYSIVIPISDAVEHNVVLALEQNGTPLSVRNKGPIWVIYPVDEAEAESLVFFREMIWQLFKLTVER